MEIARLRLCGLLGLLAALAVWFGPVPTAAAAFPGRNGVLAVQPLHGNGIVLVGADGRGQRRICTSVSVCGHPVGPRFSPDGRSIVFAGPAVRLIGTDGSCQNCQFGTAIAPAFRPGGSLVTFSSGASVLEDGFDGLRVETAVPPTSVGFGNITDAVWSSTGQVAVVAGGRIWIGRPNLRFRVIGRGSAPSWSPDGERLAFVRRGWITIERVSDRASRRVVRGNAPAFSPNGRWIAYSGAKHVVRIVWSSGGRSRAVGSVKGFAVDWQPLPAGPARCVASPGAKVLAQSDEATLTEDTSVGPGGSDMPDTAAMGCLFADGRERLLEQSTFNNEDGAADFPVGVVNAPYAAVMSHSYDGHYGGDSQTVDVFDLRTGKRSGFGGESGGCGGYGGPCSGIDRLVLGASGVTAVHVTDPIGATSDPLGVTCASESLCIATNTFGDVLSSTDPTTGPWQPVQIAPSATSIRRASCPSVSLCVLVSANAIYTSTDPAGDTNTWTTTLLQGISFFNSVSCPSTNLCVAVAGNGTVAVSTDPTGGASAWSVETVDGDSYVADISCPSSSECIASDDDGNVITTTNPTGGPGAWSVRNVASRGFGLSPIVCPSVSLCVALEFGQVFVSTNPVSGNWTATGQKGLNNGISCPSSSLCVALGPPNTIYVSTDPASGTWSSYPANGAPGNLVSISCPTTSFCAAGRDDSNVLITTDPSGGPSAWTPVFADKIDCSIASGACGTEKIIASDGAGMHLLDSTTEYGPQSRVQLTNLAIKGDTLSWDHSESPVNAKLAP